MSVILTMLALAASTMGLAELARTDPKRLRAAGLRHTPAPRRSWTWPALYLPPLILLALDQFAPLLLWLGAVPLLGWVIAVVPPQRWQALQHRLLGAYGQVEPWTRSLKNRVLGFKTNS